MGTVRAQKRALTQRALTQRAELGGLPGQVIHKLRRILKHETRGLGLGFVPVKSSLSKPVTSLCHIVGAK